MATDRFTRGWDGERHKGTRMGTLWANENIGSGDVTLRLEGMADQDSLFRADILQDWIGLLQREYDLTLAEFDAEVRRQVAINKAEENP